MELARPMFDVGMLTNRGDAMLGFWCDEMGLALERELEPVPGVTQYKLTLMGAVLKINAVAAALPDRATLPGLRMLLLADDRVDHPQHRRDPDGNLLCLVPPGFRGITTFGVHFAVSDERRFHAFFTDVLQLDAIDERMYDLAGAALSFAWSPEVVAGATTGGAGFTYTTIQVMDAVAAHAALCDRGAIEDQPPSGAHFNSDSIVSFIRDPDGNRIEISQRPDLVAAKSGRRGVER